MSAEPETWTPELLDRAERSGRIYRVRDRYFRTSDSQPLNVSSRPIVNVSPQPKTLPRGEPLSEKTSQAEHVAAKAISPPLAARDLPFPAELVRRSRGGQPAVERYTLGPRTEAGRVGGKS